MFRIVSCQAGYDEYLIAGAEEGTQKYNFETQLALAPLQLNENNSREHNLIAPLIHGEFQINQLAL